jgi:hypothetical protein
MENNMSKFGTIEVHVYDHFTVEQLTHFANVHGITFAQAESLAKEMVYRKVYSKLRSKTVEAKAERKAYNKKRNELAKGLRSLR